MNSYGICLSLSDLLHFTLWSLGSSTLLQMVQLGAVNYPIILYTPITSSLLIHLYPFIRQHLRCLHVLATVNSPMNIRGPCIFLDSSFVWIYTQEWDCWITGQLYFWFSEAPPCHFPRWLCQFTFPQRVQEVSLSSTPPAAFAICKLFNDGHSDWCEVVPRCIFDLHVSDDWQFGASLQATLFHINFLCEYMSVYALKAQPFISL